MDQVLQRLDELESDSNKAQLAIPSPESRGTVPSASDFISLSDSIQQLSLSMHSDTVKTVMEMHPEYHMFVVARGMQLKNLISSSLHPEELLYGMMGVYEYLLSSGGDSAGYLKHICF